MKLPQIFLDLSPRHLHLGPVISESLAIAQFLCKKAKVLHIAKDPDIATEALEQAKSIAKDINAKPDSELQKAINETEQFLSSPPPGLRRSEDIEYSTW